MAADWLFDEADEDQYPVSSDYSVNSDIAWDHLRSFLPNHWDYQPMRDKLSGEEHGVDWLILMTDDKRKHKGHQLRVQSKVIESRKYVTKRRVGTKMKVSTINGLRSEPVPVMLHFYDSVEKCGYCIWLDDWYDQNYSAAKWRNQNNEIVVSIPRRNLIDKKTVDVIRKFIMFWHGRAVLLKQATAASRRDPHYDFRTTFDSRSTSLEILAKHKGAPPIEYRIRPTAIDADAFARLYERGEPITFRGYIELETKLPRFAVPPKQEVEFYLFPHIDQVRFPAQIEFIGEDGETKFRISYIEFRLDKSGTKFRHFIGTAFDGRLVCQLEVDLVNHTVNFAIDRNSELQTMRSFAIYFELREQLSQSARMVLTTLQPEGKASSDIPAGLYLPLSEADLMSHRLTKALVTVEDALKVRFPIPKSVKGRDVVFAETIAEILTEGATQKPMGEVNSYTSDKCLFVTTDIETAMRMKNDLAAGSPVRNWYHFDTPTVVKLFGKKIDLGKGAYIFTCTEILDFGDFPPEVTDENRENKIQFPVQVDWAATMTVYRNWLPESDRLAIGW